jgi:hypothetical protein
MADESLAACMAEIKANIGRYYAYVLSKPDGTPFYVGVGKAGRKPMERIRLHESEARSKPRSRQNKHKLSIIRQILSSGENVGKTIDSWHDSVADAKGREVALISELGRRDLGSGPLTNLTAGGDGQFELSAESKARLLVGVAKGAATRAKWFSENPEAGRELGLKLHAAHREWCNANPERVHQRAKVAGKARRKWLTEWERQNPEAVRRRQQKSAEGSRHWAVEHQEQAKANSAKGKPKSRQWQMDHPDLHRESGRRGGMIRAQQLAQDPIRARALIDLANKAASAWRAENPDELSKNGHRQGMRNREKAAVRRECMKLATVADDLPSGRAGLQAWSDALARLQRVAR